MYKLYCKPILYAVDLAIIKLRHGFVTGFSVELQLNTSWPMATVYGYLGRKNKLLFSHSNKHPFIIFIPKMSSKIVHDIIILGPRVIKNAWGKKKYRSIITTHTQFQRKKIKFIPPPIRRLLSYCYTN